MGTTYNPLAWNATSGVASNSGADAGIGTLADSSSPDSVDNWIRGLMAAVKNQILDTDGGLAAGGTANAITLNPTSRAMSSGHVAAGATLTFRATATNTGATTLAPDGLSAVAIVDSWGQALTGGEIISGDIVTVRYNANTSKWVIISGGGNSGFPSKRCSGQVVKTSAQSISSTGTVQVTGWTESFDVGSYFASNTLTPPVGTIHIAAQLGYSGLSSVANLTIRKNGSDYVYGNGALDSYSNVSGTAFIDQCNGTDYYQIFTTSGTDASYTILSNTGYSIVSWTMV